MPVDTTHPDYDATIELQEKCRTVSRGEERVKEAGDRFLPRLSDQSAASYDAYRNRAMFYNATARTIDGLRGAIMRKAPIVEFPAAHVDMLTRVGGADEPLLELLSKAAGEVLTVGRHGVLVDATPAEVDEEGVVLGDGQPLPYVTCYEAESIINWRERMVGDRRVLELVVLQEENPVETGDEFEHETETQWRVLRLDLLEHPLTGEESAVYSQTLYRRVEEKDAQGNPTEVFEEISRHIPRRAGGKVLDFIPFVFVNPGSTTPAMEDPPLLDLVNVNLSHYRTLADLEHGRHFTALPTVVLTGVDGSDKSKGRRHIGGSSAWELENPNAKAFFLEFSGQGLGHLAKAQQEKQELMAVLGARMLEQQKNQVEAAAAIQLRQSGETSALSDLAQNLGRAYTKALRWLAMWMGISETGEDVSVELNQDYSVATISPEFGNWLMGQVQGGLMSWETYYWNLEQGEVYPEGHTMEEERDKIILGGPMPAPPRPAQEEEEDEDEEQEDEEDSDEDEDEDEDQ